VTWWQLLVDPLALLSLGRWPFLGFSRLSGLTLSRCEHVWVPAARQGEGLQPLPPLQGLNVDVGGERGW